MSRVSRLVLPAFVASALFVAACGSDDSTSSDTTTSATTIAPSDTAAPSDTPAVTDAPAVTDVPATDVPATEVPATDVPATDVPTTDVPTTDPAPVGSLIDVATAAGNFTTLLAAIDAAGLTEDIATNKYTILAPTDEAFAALGQPAIDALLADPAALTALLQMHVLPNKQTAHQIGIFQTIVNIAGAPLTVTKDGDVVTVAGATIVQPDVMADNGYLQVIDTVLQPAPAA